MNLTFFSQALMNFGFVYIFIFSVVELPFPCKKRLWCWSGETFCMCKPPNYYLFQGRLYVKSYIGAMAMDIDKWEDVANDRSRRKRDLPRGLVREEKKRRFATCVNIARRNENNTATPGWGKRLHINWMQSKVCLPCGPA